MLNNRSEVQEPSHWVSATLTPRTDHSVEELKRLLGEGDSSSHLEVINGILLFDGDESALERVERIAYVDVNVDHRFLPEWC